MFEWVDGDLSQIENDEIVKVYSRPSVMTRAEYRFVCAHIIDAQEDVWNSSIQKWKNLSNEKRKIYETKVQMEFQNFMDIREGLLATLTEYQGFIDIKSTFKDAILSAEFK